MAIGFVRFFAQAFFLSALGNFKRKAPSVGVKTPVLRGMRAAFERRLAEAADDLPVWKNHYLKRFTGLMVPMSNSTPKIHYIVFRERLTPRSRIKGQASRRETSLTHRTCLLLQSLQKLANLERMRKPGRMHSSNRGVTWT